VVKQMWYNVFIIILEAIFQFASERVKCCLPAETSRSAHPSGSQHAMVHVTQFNLQSIIIAGR
jgi:hypothetical protein